MVKNERERRKDWNSRILTVVVFVGAILFVSLSTISAIRAYGKKRKQNGKESQHIEEPADHPLM